MTANKNYLFPLKWLKIVHNEIKCKHKGVHTKKLEFSDHHTKAIIYFTVSIYIYFKCCCLQK